MLWLTVQAEVPESTSITPRDIHDEDFEMTPPSATLLLRSPEKAHVEITPRRMVSLWFFSVKAPNIVGEGPHCPTVLSEFLTVESVRLIKLIYAIMVLGGFYVAIDNCNTLYGLWRGKSDLCWLCTLTKLNRRIIAKYKYQILEKRDGGWTSASELNPYFIYPGIIR